LRDPAPHLAGSENADLGNTHGPPIIYIIIYKYL
jgi:hypothetical protein